MTDQRIRPVILSGGSGTRLWPLSRTERPKQLLNLAPPGTMLQATARRVGDSERFANLFVVANALHADVIENQLHAAGGIADAVILEPEGRNTAPAIALAAALQAQDDASVPLLVMPSDHVIKDVSAFHAAVAAALPVVHDGWLTTFGIQPTAPETGYGYICEGEELVAGVRRVERFVEKPDLATAQAYLDNGNYVWNGGIFLFRADAYLDALALHAPAILDATLAAIGGAERRGTLVLPQGDAFRRSPSDSIDFAIMEKADRVAVVPVDMGWSDIGSWDALHDFSTRDTESNHLAGNVVAIEAHNCLIRSDGPLIATVGVRDLSIICTDDAILVTPRGRSQDVKRAVDALRDRGHASLHRCARLIETWGSIKRLAEGNGFVVNELTIAPQSQSHARPGGAAVSLRILEGQGEIEGLPPLRQGETITLKALDSYCIVNGSDAPLRLLESIDAYLGEEKG